MLNSGSHPRNDRVSYCISNSPRTLSIILFCSLLFQRCLSALSSSIPPRRLEKYKFLMSPIGILEEPHTSDVNGDLAIYTYMGTYAHVCTFSRSAKLTLMMCVIYNLLCL